MKRIDIIFDIETDGLDPIKNRVTAIGVKTEKSEFILIDKDESKILERFWRFLSKFEYFRLIGFNNYAFDNYFINIRSFKHNVKVIDVKSKILDLRYILSFGNKFKNGNLGDYAELLNETKYSGLSGELMVDAWTHEKINIIIKYLRQDLRLTAKIYERCMEIGLIEK